jgi:hypothetical protein
MLKNLCDILKTKVVKGKITTNGNCFLHAFEYALGNCDMVANRQDLYNKTRREVATFAIRKIKQQKRGLLAEFNQRSRTDEEIARFYDTFEKRIKFLEDFKTNKEYSNEDIIYYAALLKRKILCIVEEGGDQRVSLVCPDIPFRKENIVFLLHSSGIHYESFQYPIHVSEEIAYVLDHIQDGTVIKEGTITIKDFLLNQLISFVVTARVNRRRTENRLSVLNRNRSKNRSKNRMKNRISKRKYNQTRKGNVIRKIPHQFLNEPNKQNSIRIEHDLERAMRLDVTLDQLKEMNRLKVSL